ncbi:MAG: zinc-ribbon domain-containing protein [Candidatus Lokiarchaeota archaeon]|nr:zinc-ribbon domain-containing protein [Candidatus Lokiarchaeota archaeon]
MKKLTENPLKCPKCGNESSSIVKAVPKGTKLVLINRCPSCKVKNKVILDFNNKEDWIDYVGEAFFTCDLCGAINKDNIAGYTYLGRGYSSWNSFQQSKKIVFRCDKCNNKRVKVTTGDFWREIEPYGRKKEKEPIEEKIPEELTCPKCKEPISKEDKVCKNCGIELICNKCGAPLVPGSNFCSNCGDPVETFDIEPEEVGEMVCPSCNEPVENDQIYCDRCGQELKCDKCGERLLEGASFCRECGDPIVKGELDI